MNQNESSIESRTHGHITRMVTGNDVVVAVHDKERELTAAWTKFLGPQKPGWDAALKGKPALAALAAFHRFQAGWQAGKSADGKGASSVAELNDQVRAFNALDGASKVSPIEVVDQAAELAALRTEVVALRVEVAELRTSGTMFAPDQIEALRAVAADFAKYKARDVASSAPGQTITVPRGTDGEAPTR